MVKKDKVFELTIEDNDEVSGVDSISLVDDPAIEINWVAFKKQAPLVEEEDGEEEIFDYNVGTIGGYIDPGIGKKKKKKLADKKKPNLIAPAEIAGPPSDFDYLKPSAHSKQAFATDEEKQIVLGPAMVPNMKIFRKDPQGNPYYVYFTADTIKQIAAKYLKNKYIDNNDMMHDGSAVPDVFVIESWIKESDNDKSTDYGFKDLPVGSWFVSMKINNPDIWSKIKSHQLNGFSVSGYFAEEPANFVSNEEMFLYAVAEILKSSEK